MYSGWVWCSENWFRIFPREFALFAKACVSEATVLLIEALKSLYLLNVLLCGIRLIFKQIDNIVASGIIDNSVASEKVAVVCAAAFIYSTEREGIFHKMDIICRKGIISFPSNRLRGVPS